MTTEKEWYAARSPDGYWYVVYDLERGHKYYVSQDMEEEEATIMVVMSM